MIDQSNHADRPTEAALSTMREKAHDYILLMFLVDDFQRALTLNQPVVEGAVSLFCRPISEAVRSNLEHKVASEMLLISEMERTVRTRGEALIKQAEAIMARTPSWGEP